WPVDIAGHGNCAVRIVHPTLHYVLHDLPGIDGGRYSEIDGGARLGGEHTGSAAPLPPGDHAPASRAVIRYCLEVEDLPGELAHGAAAILRPRARMRGPSGDRHVEAAPTLSRRHALAAVARRLHH